MNILEIFGEPINKGGQQSFVLYALQNMDLSNLKVDLFTPYYVDNAELTEFVETNGGTVFSGGLPFVPGKSRKNTIPVLRAALRKKQYDVVHIHSGSITALAYSAREASYAGVKKIIVHSHSAGEKGSIKHDLVKLYAAPILIKNATHYCTCSREAAEWEFPKAVWPKVQIINNGIDPDRFVFDRKMRNEMRRKYALHEDTIALGHVGRFSREKNQKFLIEILRRYKDQHPKEDVKLFLLGEGDDKEDVKNLANELGISKDVIFPEEYNKVPELMQMLDVFLVPSLYEGLSLVALEAQAAGLPVVASQGLPQQVKVTDYMVFISLDESDAWCNAVYDLKNKPRTDNRVKIKYAGFDNRDTAKAIQELYQE